VEIAIKDAAKNAADQAGTGIIAASVSAEIQRTRFDGLLCRAFRGGRVVKGASPCLLVTPLDCAEAR